MDTEMENDMMSEDLYTPEKFPQPRTYPNGRNMETSFAEWTNRKAKPSPAAVEPESGWELEKFPKTNTYPNGWDMSGIYHENGTRK